MGTNIESSGPRALRSLPPAFWVGISFGVSSTLRGLDRIADGRPVLGWLMFLTGAGMAMNAAWLFWRDRVASRA
jgi:hypothetical protein